MKKKLLSLALVFVMALTLLPTAAFATDDADAGLDNSTNPIVEGAGNSIDPNTITCQHTNLKWVDAGGGKCKQVCAAENCDYEVQDSAKDHSVASWTPVTGQGKHQGTCTKCSTVVTADHTYSSGTCSVCGATEPTQTPGTTGDPQNTGDQTTTTPDKCNHLNVTLQNGDNAKAATCGDEGVKEYYKCTACGSYFIQGDRNTALTETPDAVALKIPATGNHKAPTDGTGGYVSPTQHTYTCTECGKTATGDHVFTNDHCATCNYTRTSPPSPSGYVSITSAYVNSYSIDVTWRSDLADGTDFEIYVDGRYRVTVHPSKSSSGYFSATVDFSYYLDESYYIVDVYARDNSSAHDSIRVYNRYYDRDYDYWYSDRYYPNSTPSTNSSGIPYASQVNGRYSASEAIRILRNKNQGTLQYDLLNSSSASSSFYDLEQAVKRANNVSVQVDIDRSDVPGAIRNIQIVGAAFNASSTNSTVRLVVDAPTQGRYTGYGYAFSMSLTGVGGDSSLDVPVKITMPVPSDINANSVRILHYHNSNTPTVIEPKVSGSSMSFTLTGFSDFVVTDRRVDPYYYYYYTPGVPASARRSIMEEHLAVVLPILASTPPSGYVFDDVGPGHWAAAEIAWARDGGMMSGYYDGTFRPYAATTRQELWMVLARLAGARPADMWAAREWAMSAGISDGRNPHSTLSVQQMITMLYRYAQYLGVDVGPQASLRGYRDSAAISGYARSAMAWAVEQGIVVGDGDNCLNPQNIATRADFAVYLYRFIY